MAHATTIQRRRITRAGAFRLSALVIAAALASGCEKDKGDADNPLAKALGNDLEVDLSEPVSSVIRAWQGAELEVTELRVLENSAEELAADVGGTCAAATVDEIPVVLCEYETEEEAAEAEERGLELVGDATGLSIARGQVLLVAADRHEADPQGRRINEIANSFRSLK